jgi:hypothetical protein
MEAHERKKAEERKAEGWRKRGKKGEPGGKLPPDLEEGKTRDIIAARVGWSGRTYEKAKTVVDAAREDPEFHDLAEEMDRTGKVDRVFKKLPPDLRGEGDSAESFQHVTLPQLRPRRYNEVIQRFDTLMQDIVVPSFPTLAAHERKHLLDMLTFYTTMFTKQQEGADVHAAEEQ